MAARARVLRVTVERRGLAQVATSAPMVLALAAVCADVTARAVALSPESTQEMRDYFARRYGPQQKTQRYRDSFKTRIVVSDYNGIRRAIGVVENTSPHAAAVEFGNSKRRGQRVLARALGELSGGGGGG